MLLKGVQSHRVVRAGGSSAEDAVAIEEPLEIRVAGETVATTMRTPGDDHRLAAGFLFAEGIVRSRADIGTISHCGRADEEGYGNVIEVIPASGAKLPIERAESARRGTLTTSACGVCGRRTIDDLLEICPVLPVGPTVSVAVVTAAPSRLVQPNFAQTGGVHAAAALDAQGALVAGFEDVGRHNAVDKVIGELVLSDRLSAASLLVVSGRASFEIVQKAAMARLKVVASVSAPSTLAIALAERCGVTLLGFVRGVTYNVYTHPARLTGLASDAGGHP